MNLYDVTFSDGTVLEYTKQAGSSAPLFVTKPLMNALGYKSDSPGMLYKPAFKRYTLTAPLKRGQKPIMLVHLNGVLKLLGNRHPVWESEFLERFIVRFEPPEDGAVSPVLDNTPQYPPAITQDNREFEEKLITFGGRLGTVEHDVHQVIGHVSTLDNKMDRLIGSVRKLLDNTQPVEVVATPAPIQPRDVTEVGSVAVPICRSKGVVLVPVTASAEAVTMAVEIEKSKMFGGFGKKSQRTLHNQSVYVHIEGYRTYKEMLMAAGMPELVGTQQGKGLSQMMADTCRKNGIDYYLTTDGFNLRAVVMGQKRKFHLDSYSLNAYPKELWSVFEYEAQVRLGKVFGLDD